MRGDQPAGVPLYAIFPRFTPHARGSTYHDSWSMSRKIIYPACAGINPKGTKEDALAYNLPRMRGDQPMQILGDGFVLKFTPRARGLTRQYDQLKFHYAIYPACAGINPHLGQIVLICLHLPRMRGDQPNGYATCNVEKEFTPHARGSTQFDMPPARRASIYPACEGITLRYSAPVTAQ